MGDKYRVTGKVGYMTWSWEYDIDEEVEATNEDEAIINFINREYSFADDHNTEGLTAVLIADAEPEPTEFLMRRIGAPALPGFERLVPRGH